jgi:hypothetical protein
MPRARADEFRRAANRLGFELLREQEVTKGGSMRTVEPSPYRSMGRDIGAPLFYRILQQLGITVEEFRNIG